MTFNFANIDIASFFDLDSDGNHAPEFTLNQGGILLDAKQLPVLIAHTDSSATFRYFVTGTYTSGALTATLIAGRFSFVAASESTPPL